jgi:hypothetical protein
MNRVARLAAVAVLSAGIGAGVGRPQGGGPGGESYGFQTPLNTTPTVPIPIGKGSDAGFYAGGEPGVYRLPPYTEPDWPAVLFAAAHTDGKPPTWTDLQLWPPRSGPDCPSSVVGGVSVPGSSVLFATWPERAGPAPRLEVVESVDPVRTGAETVYIVRVTNPDTASDTNLVLVCELPDGMTCAGATGPTDYRERIGYDSSRAGPARMMSTVTFKPVRELGLGAEAVFRVRATAGRETGTVTFKALVTSDRIKTPITKVESTVVTER